MMGLIFSYSCMPIDLSVNCGYSLNFVGPKGNSQALACN